jgi:hypothetical protein
MTSSPQAVTTSPSDSKTTGSLGRAEAFLVLAFAGLLGQLVLVGAFIADNGLDLGEFGDQIFASTIAALTFVDLALSGVVFAVWLPREAERAGIRSWWPFAAALVGGLCFAMPLFLHTRERARVKLSVDG